MATTSVVTIHLEPEMSERLNRLAKARRRSRSFIAGEAIREYVDVNEWQMAEIRKGLEEDDHRVLTKYAGRKRVRRGR